MAGRMKADTHAVGFKRFAVLERLQIDVAQAGAKNARARRGS